VTPVSRRVFLHVGLPKSGTTYLQAVLAKNKRSLDERSSLLYPGRSWDDQVDAVCDVRRLRAARSPGRSVPGAWDRLVSEIEAWPGDSVVSMEWLCMASRGQVRRIVRDLHPAEVHVVFTVRDLARTVPAAWQEFTQNRRAWRWSEFLDEVAADEPTRTPGGRTFWAQQDMEVLLATWTAAVPAERVHVVTVPQRGADPAELWRRMAQVLGVPPDGYDLSDLGDNSSLGLESAELMRRINVRLEDEQFPVSAYNRVFKHRLAKRVLAARRSDESRVLLPAEYHAWVRGRAEQQIEAIRSSGVRVVGALDDLRPVLPEPTDAGRTATEPDPEAVLDAAVDALVGLALERRRRRLGRLGAPRKRSVEAGEGAVLKARLVHWYRGRLTRRRPSSRPRG
jgi:hypothetical protein